MEDRIRYELQFRFAIFVLKSKQPRCSKSGVIVHNFGTQSSLFKQTHQLSTMGWKSSIAASAAALLVQHALAQSMLRFGCSQLVIERSDPLVNPGINPSSHTHQIVGGNSFNFSVCSPLAILAPLVKLIIIFFLHRWTRPPWIQPKLQPAPHVLTVKISATTGQQACTSEVPRMEPTNSCLSLQTGAVWGATRSFPRMVVLLYTICHPLVVTPR